MNLKEIRQRDKENGPVYPTPVEQWGQRAANDRRYTLKALDEARPVMEWEARRRCVEIGHWLNRKDTHYRALRTPFSEPEPLDCEKCNSCQARDWMKKYFSE